MMMCYNTTSGSTTWCILALFERYFGNAYTNKKMFLPCQDWSFCKTRNLNCVPGCYLKPLNSCDRDIYEVRRVCLLLLDPLELYL